MKFNLKSLALCAAMLSFGFADNSFDEEGQRLGNIDMSYQIPKDAQWRGQKYIVKEKIGKNTEMSLTSGGCIKFSQELEDLFHHTFGMYHFYFKLATLSYNGNQYAISVNKKAFNGEGVPYDAKEIDLMEIGLCFRLGKKGTSNAYFVIMDEKNNISVFQENPAKLVDANTFNKIIMDNKNRIKEMEEIISEIKRQRHGIYKYFDYIHGRHLRSSKDSEFYKFKYRLNK